MNECRIVRKAEIGSLSLSLPLYSNQVDGESKEEKARRTIPQATVVVGVSAQFKKKNRMIRFSFNFLSLPLYIYIYIYKKVFLWSTNTIEYFNLVRLNGIHIH